MKALALLAALLLGGCSMQPLAIERAAAPLGLKLIDGLIAEFPQHRGLLLAGARGSTSYAYAFLQQDAEEIEASSVAESAALEQRARLLYRRGRDYGLRALALGDAPASDVEALYWTAVSWAALIALSKDEPELIAELPIVDALADRALELDEGFERGALHTFLISLRPEHGREHFRRAMELSGGTAAAPFVALAEAVCVPTQQRAEFESLLRQALEIDAASEPANRLANLVAQRRARWLLARTEHLFND
jgi:predicted anti-sigma-YlaC factor YlaD